MKTRHCISGCGRAKQPCHADAGLHDGGHLWLRPVIVIRLIIKTRHCISGCGRVVPSGLWCTTPHSHLMTTPLPSWRTGIRHPLHRQRTKPSSSLRVIARRNDEVIHLRQIYVRFASKIKHIHFISNYLSDSKRQQTTIVDYKHLING